MQFDNKTGLLYLVFKIFESEFFVPFMHYVNNMSTCFIMSACFIMNYHTINLGLIFILATFLLGFYFKNLDLLDIQSVHLDLSLITLLATIIATFFELILSLFFLQTKQ